MKLWTMVARLQQTICFGLLAGVAMTIWLMWDLSPALALGVSGVWLSVYPVLVAGELVLLRLSPGDRIFPRPSSVQLLRAWIGEVEYGVPVFFWRQPFRAKAIPDHLPQQARRGVVFVHGLFCNRGFWGPWMREARRLGLPCIAVNLEPVTGSIDNYVPVIDAALKRMQAATGIAPVLICHSMGGLAARAWVASTPDAIQRVARITTIATPHAGTWLAQFGHGNNTRQMRMGSSWLRALLAKERIADSALFTCWFSNADNVVFPTSNASLPGADNRLVPGVAHVALAFHRSVMCESLRQV